MTEQNASMHIIGKTLEENHISLIMRPLSALLGDQKNTFIIMNKVVKCNITVTIVMAGKN